MAENTRNVDINIILQDPKFVELSLKVMEMEQDFDEENLMPFYQDDTDEDGKSIVKTRRGDYGKDITYISSKYIRERLDTAFNKRWSFFIFGEWRESDPLEVYDKSKDVFTDGDFYLKCIGMMVIPGFGIRMDYGVKKVIGRGESSDWKSCRTDAFNRCAASFGIYLDYVDDDDSDNDNKSSDRNGRSSGRSNKKIDLSDFEYTDDELEEALETVVTFGKYNDFTLQEIMDEDPKYMDWLAEKAQDEDMQFLAKVVCKYYAEQEEEKSNRGNRKTGASGKSSTSGRSSGKSSRSSKAADNEPRSGRSSTKGKVNAGRKAKADAFNNDDEERESLIESCRAELDNLDKVRARAVMSSVSISNKYPKGKTNLDQFTVQELRDLLEVFDEG